MNLSLAATMPLGGPCPTMRFFVPTGAFFEAMKAFRGMDIVDVGAGRGHVTIALRAHGHDRVIPIDVRPDGAECKVFCANAATFSYPAGSVALLARPCHGIGLVEPAIRRALESGVAWVLYVGAAKNIGHDTGRYRRRFRVGARHVGGNGETLYVLRGSA